jgi:putative copper export protein
VFAVIGSLAAVSSFLEAFLGRITAKYAMGEGGVDGLIPEISGYSTQPVFGWIWIVSLALCILLFIYTRHLAEIYDEEVKRKYDLSED